MLGESLLSMMLRFAQENGTDLLTLWNYVRNGNMENVQKSDSHLIEITPTTMINIDKLSFEIEISSKEIIEMTFQPILHSLSEGSHSYHARILKGMIRENLHYCIQCFSAKPHFKLKWKIHGIDYCPEHGQPLLSTCLHCGNIISIKEIRIIGECPSCYKQLHDCKYTVNKYSNDWVDEQVRKYNLWEQLLSSDNEVLESSEIAIKLLYLLNNRNEVYDLSFVQKRCEKIGLKRASLMQVARKTLSQKRSIHIQTLLKVLLEFNLDFVGFIQIKVPDTILQSLKHDSTIEAACLSPWCTDYRKSGSLVRTGTKEKRYKNGAILRDHVSCIKCGCRYAFDEKSNLVTKDPFLKGYMMILKLEGQMANPCPVALSKFTGDSVDFWRRVLSYFKSRKILNESTLVEDQLLNSFINAIKHSTLDEIKKWKCWASWDHYLLYRYHSEVMKAHILRKTNQPERLNKELCWRMIVELCNQWLDSRKEITIGSISTAVNVSEKTLRKWGFHDYIKCMLLKQRKVKLHRITQELYLKIDKYFSEYTGEKAYSIDIYKYIGVKQSYLCKIAPEVCGYITERRNSYNSSF